MLAAGGEPSVNIFALHSPILRPVPGGSRLVREYQESSSSLEIYRNQRQESQRPRLWMHKEFGSSDALALSLRPHARVLLKVTAQ
jgi:hypothetical protein